MDTTQMNVAQFPSGLLRWLKIEAARRDMRMRDLVVEIIERARAEAPPGGAFSQMLQEAGQSARDLSEAARADRAMWAES